ncbi:MAG: helix-turn-helix transcriptional regulator [Bacillota bacterium]
MLRLRAERLKRKMTIRELSRRSGIAESTLSNLERGRVHPWPAYRRKLAKIFHVKADLLFTEMPEADDQARASR